MKNGIVIPCFNDETNLNLSEVERHINENPKCVLCFVNNASDDKTLMRLKDLQKKLLNSHNGMGTQMLIIDLPEKLNLSDAIKSGIHHILVNTLVRKITVAGLLFKQRSIAHSLIKQSTMIKAA